MSQIGTPNALYCNDAMAGPIIALVWFHRNILYCIHAYIGWGIVYCIHSGCMLAGALYTVYIVVVSLYTAYTVVVYTGYIMVVSLYVGALSML